MQSDGNNGGGNNFFVNRGQMKNRVEFKQKDESETDIKKMNRTYMIDIRRSNRKNLITNNRVKNMDRIMNKSNTPNSEIIDVSDQNYPIELSHLNKVKNSQRIFNLIKSEKNVITDPKELANWLNMIKNGDRYQKHLAIIKVRKILSNKHNVPIQETIDLNGVPLLIEIAKNTEELHLRMEATWCLANLVSGQPSTTEMLVNKNVIELFISILDDEYPQIIEQAVWGLGNIIGDSLEMRNKVLQYKVVIKFINILQKYTQITLRRNLIWALSNLCRIKNRKNDNFNEVSPAVDTLITAFMIYQDVSIKNDCLMGFAEYCKNPMMKKFTNPEFLKELRTFYQVIFSQGKDFDNVRMQISAFHKIIGNITNSNDDDTSAVIDIGFLTDLTISLKVNNAMNKREICWILSNIAAGTSIQIGSIINEPDLFNTIISLLYDQNTNIRRESLWTICNMTKNCNDQQLKTLLSFNILNIFTEILKKRDDTKMIILILEALPNIIQKSKDNFSIQGNNEVIDMMYDVGLADELVDLQRHDSEFIYKKVISILEEYFDLEEC